MSWLQRLCPYCLLKCDWKIVLIILFHIYSLMLFNKILLSFLFRKINKTTKVKTLQHKILLDSSPKFAKIYALLFACWI